MSWASLRLMATWDEYFVDFFRGCIDGDGSIVVYTDRYHLAQCDRYVDERLYVSIVSASYPFIDWLGATVHRLTNVLGSKANNRRKVSQPRSAMRTSDDRTTEGRVDIQS
jgi:hypothetical protein